MLDTSKYLSSHPALLSPAWTGRIKTPARQIVARCNLFDFEMGLFLSLDNNPFPVLILPLVWLWLLHAAIVPWYVLIGWSISPDRIVSTLL